MTVRRYYSGVYKTVDSEFTAFSPAPTAKVEFVSDPGTQYDATAVSMNSGKAYHFYYDHDSENPEIAYFFATSTDTDASDVAMLDAHWEDLDEVQDDVTNILEDTAEIANLPTVAEIWANSSRTLTLTPQQIYNLIKNGSVSAIQGTAWSLPFTVSIAAGRKLWFALKSDRTDPNSRSTVLIDDDGLQVVAGKVVSADDRDKGCAAVRVDL